MKMVIFPALDGARIHAISGVISSTDQLVNTSIREDALAAMPDADAFFGKLTSDLLAVATKLRWVQSPTASLEHYVFPELVAHPCQLTNMRGLFSDVIADHVMAFVLCFARNFPTYWSQQRNRVWAPAGDAMSRVDFVSAPGQVSPVDRAHQHLSDCSLGVFGVGAIGKEILKRAAGFGMTLHGVDAVPRRDDELGIDIREPERTEEMLSLCDYVVIAAPHTPRTQGLFGRKLLRHMRPSGVLINIGRGAIVPLDDLTAALKAGELRGAALDVCEQEPLPADHPLWMMENVLITPHVAAASPRVAERHLETLLDNVRRFVAGEPLRNVVNKAEWY